MNNILIRIRKIFEESGKSQTEIGKMISKTSQYVWKILNDDNANPSDSTIKDICREFKVNETWLRTGEGEPYQKRTRTQEIGEFANKIMSESDDAFKRRFILALSKLDERDWETLAKIADELGKEG